jgi:hypothetical protein
LQHVFRAKFSAITDSEVKRAMDNLGIPNKNEAMAVDARQELDLRIGCAFTRYQTKFFQVCMMKFRPHFLYSLDDEPADVKKRRNRRKKLGNFFLHWFFILADTN